MELNYLILIFLRCAKIKGLGGFIDHFRELEELIFINKYLLSTELTKNILWNLNEMIKNKRKQIFRSYMKKLFSFENIKCYPFRK
ncbi:hypothetical protein [Enterococcus mundtii]|uniref:hypothetical protein n=1 Tax=Enterococcus mundtii TaxID=53346 RepID=UPI00321B7161